MNKHEQLKEWFDELLGGYSQEMYINNLSGQGDGVSVKYKFEFYTDTYKYHIVSIDRNKDEGYLGCVASCRKPIAGEGWHRGNDLPDGPFTKETWDKIVRGIVRYELIQLSPKGIQTTKCPVINFDKAETAMEVEDDDIK